MSYIKLAGLVIGTFGLILANATLNAEASRSGYEAEFGEKNIEAVTGGQTLRQPAAEEKWQKQLSSLPALQSQNLDQKKAERAIKAAESQKYLVETFSRNIWSQVSDTPNQPIKLQQKAMPGEPYTGVHLFIFVSESVPRATLKNYLRDAEGLNAVFVLRGVLGDAPSEFMRTQQWSQSFLCSSGNERTDCSTSVVDINPNLYKLYNIRVVPTVVYTPTIINTESHLASDKESDITLMWEGDVALPYVLEIFQKERPFDTILSSYISSQKMVKTKDGGI